MFLFVRCHVACARCLQHSLECMPDPPGNVGLPAVLPYEPLKARVRILCECLFDVLPYCGYPHVTAEVRWH